MTPAASHTSAALRPAHLFAAPRDPPPDTCFWYHVMDVPGIGVTDGLWDLRGKFAEYIGNVPVEGRSVLDIGTASGFLSFEAEQAGASEVVSVDLAGGQNQSLLPFKDKLYYRDRAAWIVEQTAHFEQWKNAYWIAHRAFKSRAKAYYGDARDLPDELGTFDVAIVGAVLEHLPDSIAALHSVARRVDNTIVIHCEFLPTEDPIARFLGDASRPEYDYSFWTYSLGVYRQIFRMLGFEIVRTVPGQFLYQHHQILATRTAIVAERVKS